MPAVCSTKSKIAIFADDTFLFQSGKQSLLTIQNDINEMTNRFACNKLSINSSKCETLSFGIGKPSALKIGNGKPPASLISLTANTWGSFGPSAQFTRTYQVRSQKIEQILRTDVQSQV